MPADPFEENIVYAGAAFRGVFKTLDGAKTWESINNGIRSNTIYSTDISPDNSSTIVCGTVAGIYYQTGSQNWQLLNEYEKYVDASTVKFHPQNTKVIYAGLDWNLAKSSDGGNTWSYLDISDSNSSHGVVSIAISPENSNTLFAALSFSSMERGEVIKVIDNSTDFSKSSLASVLVTAAPVNTVTTHPEKTGVIFAGTGAFYSIANPGGLYISRDGGTTWSQTALQDVVVNGISISSSNPDTIYAACGSGSNKFSGIYKSTDGGTTWESKINGLPKRFSVSDIQVDSLDGNTVYAALFKGYNSAWDNLGGIYITIDGGSYWTQIGLSDYRLFDVNSYVSKTAESPKKTISINKTDISLPSSTIIAGTGSGLYRSTTAGSGIITGSITSEKSNDLLNDAIVSSSYIANCISVDGYYMLMVPAGVHNLQVQCPGYLQTSIQGINISAGTSVTKDITMMPVPADNGTTCPTRLIFADTPHQNKLGLLRNFRDHVLNNTTLGKHLISLYYSFDKDIREVLQKNPPLKKRCTKLLVISIPIIETSLLKKRSIISSSLLNEVSSFLYDLEQESPPALKKEINKLRRKMKDFDYDKLLKGLE